MTFYQDDFSTISHDASSGVLTLIWSEKTAHMTDEDFKKVNLTFAEQSVVQSSTRLLVDVRHFGHQFGASLAEWRLKQVIPLYQQAGVDRFAFVHGAGYTEPSTGRKEKGENFITRHFATEQAARAWLIEQPHL